MEHIMPNDMDKIKNIVIVMQENRSFDHLLGYLSLDPLNREDVDGQSIDPSWLTRFTNYDHSLAIQPFHATDPHTMPNEFDPPHERSNIAAQIDPRQDDSFPLNGFVSAIPPTVSTDPDIRRLVMSYFGAAEAPINDFFANNFTICDRWFSSLPAGTQPNRLMSMGGKSLIDVNQTILPDQDLVYDWLNQQNISWRVYHQEIPFFTMMPKWLPSILFSDKFRCFEEMESDLRNTPPDQLPQVIFVEPTYQDAPHTGTSTDDHAPAGISDGQEFLMLVYKAVTASQAFWESALMIVDYDEHGGFFDHVPPPIIPTNPPAGAKWSVPFKSLGVRIPAFIISPFVGAGGVSHNLLDHTSVLKLLGEKFGNGSYSSEVDSRPVGSVSHVLDFINPILQAPAPPPLDDYLKLRPPAPAGVIIPPQNTALQIGFSNVIASMKQHGADASHPKFGQLLG
jgi:phospholipase C